MIPLPSTDYLSSPTMFGAISPTTARIMADAGKQLTKTIEDNNAKLEAQAKAPEMARMMADGLAAVTAGQMEGFQTLAQAQALGASNPFLSKMANEALQNGTQMAKTFMDNQMASARLSQQLEMDRQRTLRAEGREDTSLLRQERTLQGQWDRQYEQGRETADRQALENWDSNVARIYNDWQKQIQEVREMQYNEDQMAPLENRQPRKFELPPEPAYPEKPKPLSRALGGSAPFEQRPSANDVPLPGVGMGGEQSPYTKPGSLFPGANIPATAEEIASTGRRVPPDSAATAAARRDPIVAAAAAGLEAPLPTLGNETRAAQRANIPTAPAAPFEQSTAVQLTAPPEQAAEAGYLPPQMYSTPQEEQAASVARFDRRRAGVEAAQAAEKAQVAATLQAQGAAGQRRYDARRAAMPSAPQMEQQAHQAREASRAAAMAEINTATPQELELPMQAMGKVRRADMEAEQQQPLPGLAPALTPTPVEDIGDTSLTPIGEKPLVTEKPDPFAFENPAPLPELKQPKEGIDTTQPRVPAKTKDGAVAHLGQMEWHIPTAAKDSMRVTQTFKTPGGGSKTFVINPGPAGAKADDGFELARLITKVDSEDHRLATWASAQMMEGKKITVEPNPSDKNAPWIAYSNGEPMSDHLGQGKMAIHPVAPEVGKAWTEAQTLVGKVKPQFNFPPTSEMVTHGRKNLMERINKGETTIEEANEVLKKKSLELITPKEVEAAKPAVISDEVRQSLRERGIKDPRIPEKEKPLTDNRAMREIDRQIRELSARLPAEPNLYDQIAELEKQRLELQKKMPPSKMERLVSNEATISKPWRGGM